MKISSIQIGQIQTFGGDASNENAWTSGIAKTTVSGPVEVLPENIRGDAQANLRVHGGPDKAICAYPQEHLHFWSQALGLPMQPGAFGENLTTLGLTEDNVCVGDVFRVGTAILQVSQPRQPCWKLARRWAVSDLQARVESSGKTGWYFRVLQTGTVAAGDAFTLESRDHPEWPIARANAIMHAKPFDLASSAKLARCPALSESWQSTLSSRSA